MTIQPGCPLCAFVSNQLGCKRPCVLHLDHSCPSATDDRWAPLTAPASSVAPAVPVTGVDHDETYILGLPRPTADQPRPFTAREYARLLLLRGRVQDQRKVTLPGATLRADWSDRSTAHPVSHGGCGGAAWACPDWLRPYLCLLTGLRSEPIEELINDCTADAESDPARAWRIDVLRAQVRLLETLHARGLLPTFRNADSGR